jgi:hypothetical protein
MATIGKVTISGGQRSTIVAQNFAPKPNVRLSEITDVDTTGVQDGDALVYDSETDKFITTTVQAFVTEINGGQF